MQYLSVAVSCFILISISVQMNAQPEGVTSKEESSQCEERELQGNLLLLTRRINILHASNLFCIFWYGKI